MSPTAGGVSSTLEPGRHRPPPPLARGRRTARPPVAVTRGTGIEWMPGRTANDGTAGLPPLRRARARARHVVAGRRQRARELRAGWPIRRFLADRALVEPQAVTFTATDGMRDPGQLFLPPDLQEGRAAAGRPLPPRRLAPADAARLALHLLLQQRLRAEPVPREPRLRGAVRELPRRHRLRPGVPRGAQLRGDRRERVQRRAGRRALPARRPDVDPPRIGLWGGSYGGYLTALGLARASDLFAAGVDIHGVHDWNVGIRTFIPNYDPTAGGGAARLRVRRRWPRSTAGARRCC